HTSVQLAQSMSFKTQSPGFTQEQFASDFAPGITLSGKLTPGATVTAEKIVVMHTSRDADDPVLTAIKGHHSILRESSFDALLADHKQAWQDYWHISDILIEGDEKAQQAIRYNIYQLRASASTHGSRYSIAAKGLTGF